MIFNQTHTKPAPSQPEDFSGAVSLWHNDAEQGLLGALLLDPKALLLVEGLEESDFYQDAHRLIYRQIVAMTNRQIPVDVLTVADSLDSVGALTRIGGSRYLGDLAFNTPGTAAVSRYAKVLRNKRKQRDLMDVSSRLAELARSANHDSIDDCIDAAQSLVFSLSKTDPQKQEAKAIGAILPDVLDDIEQRQEKGGVTGLSTGFHDLDEKTCGLNNSDLIIVAGRPSMGKTTFAVNIAEHVAVNEKKVALIFSMEMSGKQLSERSLSSIGRIPMNNIRSGQMVDDDYSRAVFALKNLSDSLLIIDDRPALTLMQMRSQARSVSHRYGGLSLIVVDYLQLADSNLGNRGGNREQEVSMISRGLKAIAKEFNIPVIALSQLSRKCEERTNKRPMLSDLRDSGAIEQDADIILMMYRDEYYNPDSPDKGVAECLIVKQRMGVTGMVPLVFSGEFSRFENMDYEAKRAVLSRDSSQQNQNSTHHKFGFGRKS